MVKVGYGSWFLKKKQELETRLGRRVSTSELADYFGVSQSTMSFWLTEDRKPSGEAALGVCKKTGDYSLLDILGYPKPDFSPGEFDHLPGELRDRLEAAMHEIYEGLKAKDLPGSPDSPEAVSIAVAAMGRHGFLVENSSSTS